MFLRYAVLSLLFLEVFCKLDLSTLPPNIRERLKMHHATCSATHNVSDDEIAKADPDSSENFKCYIYCLMEVEKWFGEDGRINWAPLDKKLLALMKKVFGEAYEKCSNVEVGPKKCDIAYNFVKCFKDVEPEKYFIP